MTPSTAVLFSTLPMKATPSHFSHHSPSLYETDYMQWIEATVEKLRCQDYAHMDWSNLIEEIKDIGKRERRNLKSNLVVLLLHLLKWHHQPTHRTGSWAGSIVEHRRRIHEMLKDSPSLFPYLERVLAEAYQDAVQQAEAEMMLSADTFPDECEFTFSHILNEQLPPKRISDRLSRLSNLSVISSLRQLSRPKPLEPGIKLLHHPTPTSAQAISG
ncbi:DUF29 domain-containing protein [Oscillatoria sp. CS-180]|uniref:DUF29 domain-containing protein n=1 Tax=Oscillatoria sp. CS-180 TaxID=3021720 RepID=UPI002FEE3896